MIASMKQMKLPFQCLLLFAGLLLSGNSLAAQALKTPDEALAALQAELLRIDALDGQQDGALNFAGKTMNDRATFLYFNLVSKLSYKIRQSGETPALTLHYLQTLREDLRGIHGGNYQFLSSYEQYFDLLDRLFTAPQADKALELTKNRALTALKALPYITPRKWAADFLQYAAGVYPYEVLRVYLDFSREEYALPVLEKVARQDPNAMKQYMSGYHPVNMLIQTSQDPVMLKLYEIFDRYGSRAQGFTLIQWIMDGKMKIEDAEALARNEDVYYAKLVELRKKQDILGSYSVDQELGDRSLSQIRQINLLHDENDAMRFASVNKSSAEELYSLMVYSQDEIFTSTFLGLYKRFMQRRPDSSGYGFLKRMGMNRFRTFIKMCAGYNSLMPFLQTMQGFERVALIDQIVKGLDKTGGNLAPAVEVADIYGSITDAALKEEFTKKLEGELRRCVIEQNEYGIRLYGLLYKLCGKDPLPIAGNSYNFSIPELTRIDSKLLFPDGKNVQLHVFYDDEDGEGSYRGFLQTYISDPVNWKLTDQQQWMLIESAKGQPVKIYVNKPANQETALGALEELFEKEKRYPDVVVHRGHSYHLTGTIAHLHPGTRIAILGSCGGYQNISRVLENAGDAQIVSSKQIGTRTVNDVLLKDMNEMLRKGEAFDWQVLWSRLNPKLASNPRWADYIPPYQNLGVRFIKAFQQI
jgi:hypothetical protein